MPSSTSPASPTPTPTVAFVVLAAGAGTRFAGPSHKLLAPFRGRPVVAWAVAAALDAARDEPAPQGPAGSPVPVVVVAGAVDLRPALADQDLLDGVTLVVNDRWREGQATSLGLGIATVDALGVEAAVVGLGDQPLTGADAWRRVASADGDRPIVVATYDGRRRTPVRLARSVWPELPTEGDEGARGLITRRPELVLEVGCPGEPADVDTLEDLARWS